MDIMSHTQFSSIESDHDIMSRTQTHCTAQQDILSEHESMEMDDAQTIVTMDDAQWILEQEFLNKAEKGNDVHLSALILIEQTLISQRLKQRNAHVDENEQIQQKLQEYLRNQQGFE